MKLGNGVIRYRVPSCARMPRPGGAAGGSGGKLAAQRRGGSNESPNQASDDNLIHLALTLGMLKVATEPLNGTPFLK